MQFIVSVPGGFFLSLGAPAQVCICPGVSLVPIKPICKEESGRISWNCTLTSTVCATDVFMLECHGFWIQQISHFKSSTAIGQILQQFSKYLCSTVYPLPVISLTETLVGWSDLTLINTVSCIQVLKTLLGKVFQTLPHGLGLGSRLSHSMVKQGGLILCSYICDDIRNLDSNFASMNPSE